MHACSKLKKRRLSYNYKMKKYTNTQIDEYTNTQILKSREKSVINVNKQTNKEYS